MGLVSVVSALGLVSVRNSPCRSLATDLVLEVQAENLVRNARRHCPNRHPVRCQPRIQRRQTRQARS